MGGWSSAKLLLDLYGHYLPTESSGYADALSARSQPIDAAPKRPYAAPAVNDGAGPPDTPEGRPADN